MKNSNDLRSKPRSTLSQMGSYLFSNSLKAIIATLMALQFSIGALAQNAAPLYPVIKSPATTKAQSLKHAETIRVRAVLATLNAGDYVDTLEISAQATQSGAGFELFMDSAKLAQVNLTSAVQTFSFSINKVNGVDYQRILIRSIGSSRITKIVARVSDPNATDSDEDLLPPPPPPPVVVTPPPPPPPVVTPVIPPYNPNDNCSTQSNGLRFSGISEQQTIQICQEAQYNFGTKPGECLANAHCKAPRMTCSTSSNGLAIVGYDAASTVQKCKAHPSTTDSECETYLRCEGGQPGPSPVPTPDTGTGYNPGYPCQTKSRDFQSGVLHRFSSYTLEGVIHMCQDYPGTDKESCRSSAVCQNIGGNTPPVVVAPQPPPYITPGNPPVFHPHPGNGHVGPLPGGTNLGGYCQDWDHTQFRLAKQFAYSGTGLNLSDSEATQWALNYNQSHACNTIQEFTERFRILRNFAYSGSGLNMSTQGAAEYAVVRAEYITVPQAQEMQRTLTAIKNFAYTGNGLNLSSSEAESIALQWLDRGYCENADGVQHIAARYRHEYNFAYSGSGLNYDSTNAKRYAISRVAPMSRCGDLLR